MKSDSFLRKAALSLAAAALLAGCGNNDDPAETFLPGDYVAGVLIFTSDVVFSAGPRLFNGDRYGLLELEVNADGTITGSYLDYNDYYNPVSLPGGSYADATYDVEGMVAGTAFELDVLDVEDGFDISLSGTITGDGLLNGELVSFDNSTIRGYAGGVVTNGEDLAVACGTYYMNGSGVPSYNGDAVFLAQGHDLIGVLYGASVSYDFLGVLEATFDEGAICSADTCNGVGTGEITGTLADDPISLDADLNDVDVDEGTPSYLWVAGNFENADYTNAGFTANTGYCYQWGE